MKNLFIVGAVSALIILQSCSWLHTFVITNNTLETWTITYTLNDHRGIFKDSITIRDKKKDKRIIETIKDNRMVITLQPGQAAEIGFARNAHYKFYSKEIAFDKNIPWKPFINSDTIFMNNGEKNFALNTKKLTPILKGNNRGFARLEINDLLKKK